MSTNRVAARIAGITPSATLAVSSKAKALKAEGKPVIGFGAGEPDFATPDYIVEAAVAACVDATTHRYSPAAGLPALRQAIAQKAKSYGGVDVEAAQVVVTNGGKHAVYNAIAAIVGLGDEVIIPAPYWTTYPEPVRLAGGQPVVVAATIDAGFKVTVDQLEAARTKKTKALIFVSPSNPSGAVYSRDEIEAIGQWAVRHGIWVLTDEIYEHLTYGDNEFHSILAVVPELAGQTIIVNGVAKTYAMTGWRVGWAIAPVDITKAMISLQSHQTSNVANVSQRAALAAVEGGLGAVEAMRQSFDNRRQVMYQKLAAIDGVQVLEPQGAFYAFPLFEAFIGRTVGGVMIDSTLTLADVALEQANVAFVPGEAFGMAGYGRFSFALGDDDIDEGLDRLAKLFVA